MALPIMDTVDDMLPLLDLFTKCLTLFNLSVSLPLYLLILRFILHNWRNPPFNSPFFACFFVLGLVDSTKYCLYVLKKCSYWDVVPPFFLPADRPNAAATLHYFVVWALAFCQYELNILIALNRLVAILFPLFYRRRWNRRANVLLIGLVALCSVGICVPILWQPVCLQTATILGPLGNVTKFTGPVFVHVQTRAIYYSITKAHNYIVLLLCLFGYPLMLLRIRASRLNEELTAVEVRMLISSCFLLAANLLYLVYFFAWDVLGQECRRKYGHLAESWLYIILDVYDMMGPYAMLLSTGTIRRAILPTFLSGAGKSDNEYIVGRRRRRRGG